MKKVTSKIVIMIAALVILTSTPVLGQGSVNLFYENKIADSDWRIFGHPGGHMNPKGHKAPQACVMELVASDSIFQYVFMFTDENKMESIFTIRHKDMNFSPESVGTSYEAVIKLVHKDRIEEIELPYTIDILSRNTINFIVPSDEVADMLLAFQSAQSVEFIYTPKKKFVLELEDDFIEATKALAECFKFQNKLPKGSI